LYEQAERPTAFQETVCGDARCDCEAVNGHLKSTAAGFHATWPVDMTEQASICVSIAYRTDSGPLGRRRATTCNSRSELCGGRCGECFGIDQVSSV